ncbi:hypothetical protein [Echinicola shivajiensis]|uniref:hypothetical protein n=1 Tax=Echinicola shivajiensis TaxID=1035916 RepID=UPI001BFC546D|nr:hypothetical protein [Echinicola shivajiensis]
MYKATLLYTSIITTALTFFNAVNIYAQTYTYTSTNVGCDGDWETAACWVVTATNCTPSNTYPPSTISPMSCQTEIIIDGDVTCSYSTTKWSGTISSLTVYEGSTVTFSGNVEISDEMDINLEGNNTTINIGGNLTYKTNSTVNVNVDGNNSSINTTGVQTVGKNANINLQFDGLYSSYNVNGNFDMDDDAYFSTSSTYRNVYDEITNYVNVQGNLLLDGRSTLHINENSGFDIEGTTSVQTPANSEANSAIIDIDSGIFNTKSIYINGNTWLTFFVEEDSEVRASEPGGTLDMNGTNSHLIFNGDYADTGDPADADRESVIDVGGAITTNGNGAYIEADDALILTCGFFDPKFNRVQENEGLFDEDNCRLLPVIWNDITGQWNELINKSLIQWSTVKEWENSHFEIERSINDVEGFKVVGKVNAVGWSDKICNYEFSETLVLFNNPILYYRVKQVNLNGSFAYSPVIAIKTQSNIKHTGWRAYPNPSNGTQLSLASLNQEIPEDTLIEVKIYSSNHISQVLTKKFNYSPNINLDEMINMLGKGVHILEINWKDNSQKIKLLNR